MTAPAGTAKIHGGTYPVLMYHALRPGPDPERYVLTPDGFRRHLTVIRAAGCTGVSLEQLHAGAIPVESRPVVITFDDGAASDREVALPLLAEFGFHATFFITTGRVDTGPEWLSWDDVDSLRRAGMDVQAHGHTHRFMDGLGVEAATFELKEPQRLLEERLGVRPVALSFPGGRYTRSTVHAARELGYRDLCTSEPGLNQEGNRDGLIRRFTVTQGLADRDLLRIVNGDMAYTTRARVRYRVARLAKGLLGNSAYHILWRLAFRRKWRG
ncbi:MAG: polysaccharide deacetylase family protein [Nitrospirota bacterium]|nr:polysaccharide deacetylase family protein [Nitrospirota bacterium]